MVTATFCWKTTEFKSVLSQIPMQGTGFQSTCFLSPWAWSSETSLHRKSWIIYHKRRIHWAIFRNLLQSRNYHEARLLLVCKQEAFQSLSKTFVQSVNLMQQLPQDVLNMFSSTSWTTIPIKWGSNLSLCSCTIWWLHFAFGNHFSFNSHQKVT